MKITNKKLKYGGFAALLSAGVIAALVVINLIVGILPVQFDLSGEKLYTLSPQTVQIVQGLKEPVTIYAMYQTGKEQTFVWEILQKYSAGSKKVTLKTVDPLRNPTFAKKYSGGGEEAGENGLIVESGNRFRVIPSFQLFNYSYDQGNPQATSLAVEQRVTGAIMYVAGAQMPTIGTLQGHGEQAMPYPIQSQLETENYTFQEVNLLTGDVKPDKINCLMVIAPAKDLSTQEVEKITNYLSAGGRALFMVDYTEKDLPNLKGLLASYGVDVKRAIIMEGDNRHFAANVPLYLVPDFGSHDIVNPIKTENLPVLIPNAQVVQVMDTRRRSLEITPLLNTSPLAYGKTSFDSAEKNARDLTGPFDLAVAVVDKAVGDVTKGSKLVVFGTAAFVLDSNIVSQVPANTNLVMNSVSWLAERNESISIRPKNLMTMRLRMNELVSLVLSGVVVIVIPFGLFGAAVVVWLRRRHL